MRKKRFLGIFSILLFLCSGCGQNDASAGKLDYEETKKMVVDILKSDNGKKAIQEVLKDEKVKSEFILDQETVANTIQKTLTSEKGKTFWEKSFKDPKFTAAYAKSLRSEHKKLLKDLTKDPDYRNMIIEIIKDPEVEKSYTTALKSKEMRKIYKETLIETMDSPLVKAKIEEILLKAAAETSKGKSGESKGSSSSQEDGGGESSSK